MASMQEKDYTTMYLIPNPKNEEWWNSGGREIFNIVFQTHEGKIETNIDIVNDLIAISKKIRGWSWKNPPYEIYDINDTCITKLTFTSYRIGPYILFFVKYPIFIISAAFVAWLISRMIHK